MDDVTRIFPGFYLGSVPAVNRSNLDDHGITHIVSVLNGFKPKWTNMYKYLHIDIIDTPSSELYQYFEKTFEFIEKGRQEGAVLVHCFAGISRSATVVVAYIMRKLKLTLDDALGLVTDARPIVCPNEGFIRQLQKYEVEIKANTIKAKTTLQSKIYYYGPKNTAFNLLDEDDDDEDEDDDDDFTDDDEDSSEDEKDKKKKQTTKATATTKKEIISLSEATLNISISDESKITESIEIATSSLTTTTTTITDSKNTNEEEEGEENENEIQIKRELGQYRYCCRGCSKDLFLDFDIMEHDQGSGQTAFKWNKRDHHDTKKENIQCTSFFIGEIDFVLAQTYNGMDGKLNCDKCNEKLGSWSWSGEQCSCGAWIAPSFQIPKTRVDEKRVL